jgi:hypothetical protein
MAVKTRVGTGGRILSTFLMLAALWLAGCKAHRLEDFSGDSGAELMRSQLQAAVEDLTRAISSQMNGASQPSSPLAVRFAGDE